MKKFFKNSIILSIIVLLLLSGGFFVGKALLRHFGRTNSLLPENANALKKWPDNVENSVSFQTRDTKGVYESGSPAVAQDEPKLGLKIEKHGFVSITVNKEHFLETWNNITSFSETIGGKVVDSNYSKNKEFYNGTITVMVPSNQFDSFLNKISEFGKVENLDIKSENRTGEYVDLGSRLKVLEAQRDLLLNWLKNAKSVSDMLKIRSQLSSVEQQLETIKGRLNYIAFHVNFSDIHITLTENHHIVSTNPVVNEFKHYLNVTILAFIYSVMGMLIILVFVLPWLLLGFGIYKIFVSKRNKS